MLAASAAIGARTELALTENLDAGGVAARTKRLQNAEKLSIVIPGRAKGASPESRCKLGMRLWIPGPALRAVPE